MSKIWLLPRDLFLLYRQKDIDKKIEGNYRNYVIDKLNVWDYEFYEWYIFQQNTRVYMVKNRIMQGGKGLTNKKAILHMQHTFLWISLPLFCTTTTWNFQKLLSYTFFGGNVVRVLVHFVFTAAHFHLALVTASISHFVAATKFSCCSSNKKCLHVGTYSQKRPHVSDH